MSARPSSSGDPQRGIKRKTPASFSTAEAEALSKMLGCEQQNAAALKKLLQAMGQIKDIEPHVDAAIQQLEVIQSLRAEANQINKEAFEASPSVIKAKPEAQQRLGSMAKRFEDDSKKIDGLIDHFLKLKAITDLNKMIESTEKALTASEEKAQWAMRVMGEMEKKD